MDGDRGTAQRFARHAWIAWWVLLAAMWTGVAHAAPRDAQAEKAIKTALEEDYLQTDFDAAESRLQAALKKCGSSGCSGLVKARLLVALGTVLAGGKNQLDDAKQAFVEALGLDPNVQPDPDFVRSEIAFAYQEARKQLKLGEPAAAASNGVVHQPVTEQVVNTPVPLQVSLDPAVAEFATKVVVLYRGPSSSAERLLALKMIDGGTFRGEIPCSAVEKEGTLRYRVEVRDDTDAVVATVASEDAPLVTEIKEELDGEPPSWPGFAAPESCGGKKAPTGGRQCVDDSDCPGEVECVAGKCKAPPRPEDDEEDSEGDGDIRRNWITVSFAPDISMVSGDDVCSKGGQEDDHWVCARDDGSRYVGTPTPGQANNVNTGFGLSTMRLALAYDRIIGDNVGLGLKAGFAFRGTSEADASFLPLHLEGRATYFFGSEPFKEPGTRPFIQVAAGLAQVDTEVEVEVVEDGVVCGALDPNDLESACTEESSDGRIERRVQTLRAHKQAGQGFAGVGLGLSYAPVDALALNLGVRVSVTLPVTTLVFSPEAGVALGF